MRSAEAFLESLSPICPMRYKKALPTAIDRFFQRQSICFADTPPVNQQTATPGHGVASNQGQLGDHHAVRCYLLVAAKVSESVIRQALTEIKAGGAADPPKLFTHKMKRYAIKKLKTKLVENGE